MEEENNINRKAYIKRNIYYLPENYKNMILTSDLKWTYLPNYKKCHCNSKEAYKSCCKMTDDTRTEKYIALYNKNLSKQSKTGKRPLSPTKTNLPEEYSTKFLSNKGEWINLTDLLPKKSKCHCGSNKKYIVCCKVMDGLRTNAYYRDILGVYVGPKEHIQVGNKNDIRKKMMNYSVPIAQTPPVPVIQPKTQPSLQFGLPLPSLNGANSNPRQTNISIHELCKSLKEMEFSTLQIMEAVRAHKMNTPVTIDSLIANIEQQPKDKINSQNNNFPPRQAPLTGREEESKGGKLREEFICPITQKIMVDPVVIADGRSYERKAIEGWFKYNLTSPITHVALNTTHIFPNIQLRNLITSLAKLL